MDKTGRAGLERELEPVASVISCKEALREGFTVGSCIEAIS